MTQPQRCCNMHQQLSDQDATTNVKGLRYWNIVRWAISGILSVNELFYLQCIKSHKGDWACEATCSACMATAWMLLLSAADYAATTRLWGTNLWHRITWLPVSAEYAGSTRLVVCTDVASMVLVAESCPGQDHTFVLSAIVFFLHQALISLDQQCWDPLLCHLAGAKQSLW